MSNVTTEAALTEKNASHQVTPTRQERRSTDEDSHPEVLLIVDVAEAGNIAGVDLRSRSRLIKQVYNELTRLARRGDVIRPVNSSRIQVMLRSVPPSHVERVAARLEGALRLIEVEPAGTLDARVRVAAGVG